MLDYIHQHPEWPSFRWAQASLADRLAAVRHRQGRLTGWMESLGFQLRAEAVLETLTEDVTNSSAIEGETLDRTQVRSSLARRLGLEAGALPPADRSVEGIVQVMLDATQNYSAPLTEERLCGWHAALFPTGYSGLKRVIVGRWRDETVGPMQVVSGPCGRERVHFEAPSANRLPGEMNAFLSWFNEEPTIDPVLKAALSHLRFVTIHPFEDGNGRIARAIADMALTRSDASPQRFYSMSAQILKERNAYYDVLETTQKRDLDVTAWVEWFLACLHRAFDGSDVILGAVLRKARFWQRHASSILNERQHKMLNRLLDGFEGKLTSSKWAKITKTSQDTASRDIADLVRRDILFREPGDGRSTGYILGVDVADLLHAVAAHTIKHAGGSVWTGRQVPNPTERKARREQICRLAGELDMLADSSLRERITYQRFEHILSKLHEQGFFLSDRIVSSIAFAISRDQGITSA